MADFYSLLGVASDASIDEIKRSYRKLAVELHPDRNPSPEAEERFKELTLAYQTLSTPARRKRYDDERRRASAKLVLWKGPPKRERGADLTYRLEIVFEQMALGTLVPITFPRKATCGECGGSGAALDRAPVRVPPCADCGGRGKIEGDGRKPRTCERCQGRGLEPIEACAACGGEGRKTQNESIDVPIPAGIESGRRLRLAGWGEDGPGGGEPGALFVAVTVAEHPLLRREGDDVTCEVPIGLAQALLGAEIRVPTVDGVVDVKVPPASSPGTTLKLKGRGIRRPDDKRGDQMVKLDVLFPSDLTAAQREALSAFATTRPPEADAKVRDYLALIAKLHTP